jgi:hypothetical protein
MYSSAVAQILRGKSAAQDAKAFNPTFHSGNQVPMPATIDTMRRPQTKTSLTSLVILLILLISQLTLAQKEPTAPAGKETAPDVPDAIAVPAGQEVVFFASAKGSQIYTCQADADGKFAWTLKAPDAELRDRQDKVIGQHSAGPSWKLKDSSEVTGKAVAHVDALDSDSIPWLLVNVVSHAGKGKLENVTTIQRVHTHGGKPGDSDVCDEAHKDAETKSAYKADYYFFAPPK